MESLFQDDDGFISLAYRSLNYLPNSIANYLGERTEILDLSHNEFRDLSFLISFPYLHTLVLDRNPNPDNETLPYMKNLEILWLNNCNIINTYDWLYTIRSQCPQLKQLSMMCNPVGQTELNGVTNYEEIKYRKEILKILPTLDYFDGIIVTDKERNNNNKDILNDNNHYFEKYCMKTIFDNKLKNILNFSIKQNRIKYKSLSTSASSVESTQLFH